MGSGKPRKKPEKDIFGTTGKKTTYHAISAARQKVLVAMQAAGNDEVTDVFIDKVNFTHGHRTGLPTDKPNKAVITVLYKTKSGRL